MGVLKGGGEIPDRLLLVVCRAWVGRLVWVVEMTRWMVEYEKQTRKTVMTGRVRNREQF